MNTCKFFGFTVDNGFADDDVSRVETITQHEIRTSSSVYIRITSIRYFAVLQVAHEPMMHSTLWLGTVNTALLLKTK